MGEHIRNDKDRSVYVSKMHSSETMAFDVSDYINSTLILTNLTAEQAYALHDWIAQNITRPVAPTLFETQWPQVQVGDEFGFGDTVEYFPYVKTGEDTYEDTYSGTYRANVSDLAPSDHARGITWRTPPKPTALEQFQALRVGAGFTVSGDNDTCIKVSEGSYYNVDTRTVNTAETFFQVHDGLTVTEEEL